MSKTHTPTRRALYRMVERYEADPSGSRTCDLLCLVLDSLPGQPEGDFTPDQIREMIAAADLDD